MTTPVGARSVERLARPGVAVRRQGSRERGSSAVESGLTVAGVAVFLTPFLFYFGMQVRQGLDAPCDSSSVVDCSDDAGGSAPGGGSGGGGPGSGDPTVALQGRVVTIVAAASAVCDGQSTLAPPRNTTAPCTVTFADGRIPDYPGPGSTMTRLDHADPALTGGSSPDCSAPPNSRGDSVRT